MADISKNSVKRFHRKGFKGHVVNPARQSDYRRDGLTNHERVVLRRKQRGLKSNAKQTT